MTGLFWNVIRIAMLVIPWIMICEITIVVGFNPAELPPELLDSLVMQLGKENQTEGADEIRENPIDDGSVTRSQYDKHPGKVRQNKYVSPLGPTELSEADCPNVHCFTFRNQTTKRVQLECTSVSNRLSSFIVLDRVHCRYWKNPTTPTGVPGAGLDLNGPSTNEGRGFDLKIILSPSTESELSSPSKSENVERRLQIDELSPGILGRLIHTLRISLHMQQSPVHLTLSFIYINKLRRIDLGDLSTRSHVTRLSLWNPFEWDEDSLIPERIVPDETNYIQTTFRAQVPPYFRLTVFCDHANRNPSFRRLWLPWKSWQVRFNHCHDLYLCRTWLSKYPICDNSESDPFSSYNFMPSSFLMPKLLDTDVSTLDSKPIAQTRSRGDNQIMYENQCQIEPNLFDPLDDLKLDYERSCWQPGAYQPRPIGDTLEFVLPEPEQMKPNNDEKNSSSSPLTTKLSTNTTITTINAATISPTNTTTLLIEKELKAGQPPEVIQIELPTTNATITTKTSSKEASQPTLLGEFGLRQTENITKSVDVDHKISQTYLTTAVIILSLLVIFLLLSLIFLILWMRARQRRRGTKWKSARTNGFLPYSETMNKYNSHLEYESASRQSLIDANPQIAVRCVESVKCPKTSEYQQRSIWEKNASPSAKIPDNQNMETSKQDKIVRNRSRPIGFGDNLAEMAMHDPNNQRPPITPNHRTKSRRVRCASHPSESPSQQRKRSGCESVDRPNDSDDRTERKRTPSQGPCAHGLNSSQTSLQSRSRTRLHASSKSSLKFGPTDVSTTLDERHPNSGKARLRPEQFTPLKIKNRKFSPNWQPRKQHTLVFENGNLDEAKLPIGLRGSLNEL